MDVPRRRRTKEELYLCMGSACHQLGVYDVLPRLQQLLHAHGLGDEVELRGAFCLEHCADGISMKHRSQVFQRINPQNVDERFEQEILPSLQAAIAGWRT